MQPITNPLAESLSCSQQLFTEYAGLGERLLIVLLDRSEDLN